MNFASSKWIWNSATATANTVVGLRKDFTPPLGKSLSSQQKSFSPYNVFAFNASTSINGADEGGLMATILLTYSDGTKDTLVTDSSWRVKGAPPLGFEQLSFDNTAWPVDTVVGNYGVA
ncbi:hypothetical protein B0H14DRAFT_3518709 [Mycena olivaceomarginata]|nr:hypothetical protein B0H14DRAFT_3518709 [Mycena olivaceomarginata]